MLKKRPRNLEELQLLRQLMNGQEIQQRLKRGPHGRTLEGPSLVETALIGALIASLQEMRTTILD